MTSSLLFNMKDSNMGIITAQIEELLSLLPKPTLEGGEALEKFLRHTAITNHWQLYSSPQLHVTSALEVVKAFPANKWFLYRIELNTEPFLIDGEQAVTFGLHFLCSKDTLFSVVRSLGHKAENIEEGVTQVSHVIN